MQRRDKKTKRKAARALIEPLSPRILYSVDIFGLGGDIGSDIDSIDNLEAQLPAALISNDELQPKRTEIVFVDTSVHNYQQIIDSLTSSTDQYTEYVVHTLSSSQSIADIDTALAAHSNLDAIHFITHGDDANFSLGTSVVNNQTLQQYTDSLSQWGESLAEHGDILFYGCNLAETNEGQKLVTRIAEATNADVGASDNNTGHASLNGDWQLEFSVGTIDTDQSKMALLLNDWESQLQLITVTTTDDIVNGDVSSVANLIANNGGDGISLREAILAANTDDIADEIILDAPTPLYTLSHTDGALDITNPLTINGVDPETKIQGNSTDRVILIDSAGKVTISNVTITGGFTSNGPGGGIFIIDTVVTLKDLTLDGNTANIGGGLAVDSSIVEINNKVIFSNNYAGFGGGLSVLSGIVEINDATFEDNVASTRGGGLYVENGAIEIHDSEFTNNHVRDNNVVTTAPNNKQNGGGIYLEAGQITAYNVDITGNTAVDAGGGLYQNEGEITALALDISHNETTNINDSKGGGAFVNAGVLNSYQSTFDNNSAFEAGGAAYVVGTFNAADTHFISNDALIGGALHTSGLANIDRSLFETNVAFNGGAVFNDGTTHLVDTTLSENIVIGQGSAIRGNTGEVHILRSTISDNINTANQGDHRAISHPFGPGPTPISTVTLERSLVAENISISSSSSDLDSDITSLGYNLTENAIVNSLPTDQQSVADTGIADSLADNGGFVQTYRLDSTSRAINPEVPPPTTSSQTITDATGAVRDTNPDIGAYEYRPTGASIGPSVVINTELTLPGNETRQIPFTLLSAIDPDTDEAGITFEITSVPALGNLLINGTAAVTGATFTQQDILDQLISYQHNGPAGIAGADSFSFTVAEADGSFPTAEQDFNITIEGENFAPVLDISRPFSLNPQSSGQSSGNSDPVGTSVADILRSSGGDPITDINVGDVEYIALNDAIETDGVWQFKADPNDTIWSPVTSPINGVVHDGHALLLAPSSLIRFVPIADFTGEAEIKFRAYDGTLPGKSAGDYHLDPSPYTSGLIGPNGSFSSDDAVATTSFIPALENILPISIETDEDVPFQFTGANTVQIDDGSEQDNELNVSLQVTNGTLSVTPVNALANNVTGNGTSTIRIEGLRSEINTTLTSLEFTPDPNYHNDSGSPFDTLTVESWADVDRQLNFSFDNFDNSTNIVFDDNAGTSNDGILFGNATIAGINSRLEVNGAGGVEIGNGLGITDELTFSAWLRNIPSTAPNRIEIISIEDSVSLYYEPQNNTLVGVFIEGGTTFNTTKAAGIDLQAVGRHHVAYTVDSNNHRQALYVNGVLVAESSHIPSDNLLLNNATSSTTVGGSTGSNNHVFFGRIDDVNIFSRSLSAEEINSLHEDGDRTNDATRDISYQTQDVDVIDIIINPINDPPTITVPEEAPLNYSENGGPLNTSTEIIIEDMDGDDIQSAIVNFSNYKAGEDQLSISVGGPQGSDGITTDIDQASGTITITLTGTASADAYQAAIRTIEYTNLSEDPSPITKTITYTVFDSSGASATATRDLEVIAVNDAPAGTDNTLATDEDTPVTILPGDFGFLDSSDGNAFAAVTISTLPVDGTLTLAGTAVTAGQLISITNINNNELVFTPAPNDNGNTYTDFTFQVHDNGGTANGGIDQDQTPNTLTLDVNSINDAPDGSDNTLITNEDTLITIQSTDFGFSDNIDGNAFAAVTITTLPVNGTLTLAGAAVNAGQLISITNINNSELVFTPAANDNGAAYSGFTFQVHDNGGIASSGIDQDQTPNTITINVDSINDAPDGTDNTLTTVEDTPVTIQSSIFGFSDTNDGDAFAAVTITTLPVSGTLTLAGTAVTMGQLISITNINNSELVFTPALNDNGIANTNFTFQVHDNGGTTTGGIDQDQTPNIITINVDSINDAPDGNDNTLTVIEDTPFTILSTDFGFSDTLDGDAFAAVTITTLPANGTLTLAGTSIASGQLISITNINNNELVFTPAPDANGVALTTFDFQVHDNGGNANGGVDQDQTPNTITFDVLTVNDSPAGTDNNIAINEDSAHTFSATDFGFSDPADGDAFDSVTVNLPANANGTLTLSGSTITSAQQISITDITNGNLVYTPAPGANGTNYDSLLFNVADTGGTANGGIDTDQTNNIITFDITSINDAPAGTDNTLTTDEDTSVTILPGDFGFSDNDDSNAFAAVTITTLPGNGTLTLAGANVTTGQLISITNINNGELAFTHAANDNGTAVADFTFQVHDNGGDANSGIDQDQTPNTITFDVFSVNDPPAGTDNNITINEDTTHTFTATDFGFSDPVEGNTFDSVTVNLPANANGTLTLSGSQISGPQQISITDINTGNLVYTPAPGDNGINYDSLLFNVVDTGGTANGGIDTDQTNNIITFDITSINDAPAGTDNTLTTDEDTFVTILPGDFGFSDNDDSNAFAAVTITTLPVNGTLTLAGAAVTTGQLISITNINNDELAFTPDPDSNGSAYADFTFQVHDNGGNANGGVDQDQSSNKITIDIQPVDDSPTIPQLENSVIQYTENSPAVITSTGIDLADPDGTIQSATVEILNYAVGEDELLVDSTTLEADYGIIAEFDVSTGTVSLTGAASPMDYQLAIKTIEYINHSDDPSTDDREIRYTAVDDTGNSGTRSRGLEIIPVNDTPALSSIEVMPAFYVENNLPVGITGTLGIEDVDDLNIESATVTITTNYNPAEDFLALENPPAGITAVFDDTSGVLTLTGSASVSDYQNAIRAVSYQNTSENPDTAMRTVGISVNDGDVTSDVLARDITVIAINDAPTLSTIEALPANYTENSINATGITGNLTIEDIDDINIETATVTITGNYSQGKDLLVVDSAQLPAGITGFFDQSNGQLTLSGTASAADYQLAIKAVGYQNTSNDPSTLTRTVSISVNDGDVSSNVKSREIIVTAVNDPPVTDNTGSVTTTEDTVAEIPFSTFPFSDVENNELLEISIISADTSVSVNNVAQTVTYTPLPDFTGTDTFQFVVTDDGGRDNNGEDTSGVGTMNVIVTAVNDSPSADDSNLPAVAEDSTPFGQIISTLIDPVFQDIDTGNTLAGIAITGNPESPANGVWQYALPGEQWQSINTPTDSASATESLLLDKDTAIRFLPAPDYNGNALPLEYRAIDNSYTGAFTTIAQRITDNTVSVNNDSPYSNAAQINSQVNPVNDAPVIEDAQLLAIDEDSTLMSPQDILALFSPGYSDVDGTSAISGIAVTGNPAPASEGVWQYSPDGTSWFNINAVSETTALVLDSSTLIKFNPAPDYHGTPSDLKIYALDGTYTGLTSISNNAADRVVVAISTLGDLVSAEHSIATFINPVNDAPVAIDTVLIAIAEDNASPTGELIGSLVSSGVTDVDTALDATHTHIGLAITENNEPSQNGVWQFQSPATPWQNIGSVNAANALVLDTATGIRFLPQPDYNGVPQPLKAHVIDSSYSGDITGTTAGFTDTRLTGNTTPFSNEIELSTSVTALNDAPVIADAVLQPLLEDTNTTTPVRIIDLFAAQYSDVDGTAAISGIAVTGNPANSTEGSWQYSTNGTDWANINAASSSSALLLDRDSYIRFSPAENYHGDPAELSIRAVDGTFTGNFTANNANRELLDTTTAGTTVSDEHPISIDILPVNDAPQGTDNTVITMEDASYIFTTTDFGFSDPVESDNFAAVTVRSLPQTGNLVLNGTIVDITDLTINITAITNSGLVFVPDANDHGQTSWDFSVHDNGGSDNNGIDQDQTLNTITIEILPVNDAPAGSNGFVQSTGGVPVTLNTEDFGFTDFTDGHDLDSIIVDTLPQSGALLLNNVPVIADQQISRDNINAGLLTYTATINSTLTESEMTFRVVDTGGTPNDGQDTASDSSRLIFDVAPPANTPPVSSDATVTLIEDTSYQFAASDFEFDDPADGHSLSSILITDIPTQGTLTHNNVPVTAGSVIVATDLSGLLYTPSPSENGEAYASFGFKVTDNGTIAGGGDNTSVDVYTITLSVTPVNDAPTGSDTTLATDESTTVVLTPANFGFSDPADENNLQSVTIEDLPTTGALLLDQVLVTPNQVIELDDIFNGALTYVPAPVEVAASTAFTFKVTDDGGTENNGEDTSLIANTITIQIGADNNPPTGSDQTLNLQEDETVTLAPDDFGFADPVDGHNLAGVVITALPVNGNLVNNGNVVSSDTIIDITDISAGNVQYIPALNENGTNYAAIEFKVIDDGKTDSGKHIATSSSTLTFNVTPVNDEPTQLSVDGNLEVAENSSDQILANLFFTDADIDDSHQFSVSDDRFAIANNQLVLRPGISLDFESEPVVPMQITVTDSAGATATHDLVLQVLNVNEAPVQSGELEDQTGTAPFEFVLPQALFTDADSDDLQLSATLADGSPLPAWLEFDPDTGTFTIFDDEQAQTIDVVVTATDPDDLSTTSTPLQIAIEPAIEPAFEAALPFPVTEPIVEIPEEAPVVPDRIVEESTPDVMEEAAPAADAEQNDESAAAELFDASTLTLSEADSLEQQQQREVIQFGSINSAINSLIVSRDPLGINLAGDFNILLNNGSYEAEQARRQSEYTSATLKNLANMADQSQSDLVNTQVLTTKVLATSVTLSSGFSVGYILWLLRGGTLLASVMASMPAWRAIDPLPILESLGGDDDGDTETLESMVEEDEDPDAPSEQDTDKAA